jgi:tetratricopeptide (TPR) repeat protein
MTTSAVDSQVQERAFSERRLGLLILENKDGAALLSGIPHFQAAIAAWKQLHWPTRVAEIQCDLALLHCKAGNRAEAAISASEAFHAFAGANDERAIDAGIQAGAMLIELSRASEAQALLERAAAIADEKNDHLKLAGVRLELARALIANDDALAALATVRQAEATFASFKRRGEVARCQEIFADAYTIAGEGAAAVTAYEAAIATYGELGRPVETGEVLARFADWHRDRGDLAAAEAVLDRLLAIYTQTGKNQLVAQTLRRLGTVHAKRGDAAKAEERFLRSLELCRSLDDREGLSRTLYLLGASDLRAGRADAGLARLQESLAAAEAINAPVLLQPVLAAIARVLRSRGELDSAIAVMQRWVAVLKQQGDRADALAVLGSIAEVYQDKGAWDDAEAHLQRLLRVTGTPADRDLHVRTLRQLAGIEARRGAWSEARAHLLEAIEALGSMATETRAALSAQLGHVCLQQADAILQRDEDPRIAADGHSDCLLAAVDHLQVAERLLRAANDEPALARVLVDLGNAKVLLGRLDEAKSAFDQAADACEKQGDVRATQLIRRATLRL